RAAAGRRRDSRRRAAPHRRRVRRRAAGLATLGRRLPRPSRLARASFSLRTEEVPMRKLLAKLLLFSALEIGALCGVPMSPQQIESLMEVMNRTEIMLMIEREGLPLYDRGHV